MAKAAKSEVTKVDPLDRIARILALLLVRGLDKDDAALQLEGAGFDAREISEMLGVSGNYLHSLKNRRKTSKKRKASKS